MTGAESQPLPRTGKAGPCRQRDSYPCSAAVTFSLFCVQLPPPQKGIFFHPKDSSGALAAAFLCITKCWGGGKAWRSCGPACRNICLESTRLLPLLHHHLLEPSVLESRIQKQREGITHTKTPTNQQTFRINCQIIFLPRQQQHVCIPEAQASRSCAAAIPAGRRECSHSYLPEQPLPFHIVGTKMPLTAHRQEILASSVEVSHPLLGPESI